MAGAVREGEAGVGFDHGKLALRTGQRESHLAVLVGGQGSLRQLGQDLVQPLGREDLEAVALRLRVAAVGGQQGDRAGDVAAEALEQPVVVGGRDPGGEGDLSSNVLLGQQVAEEGEAGAVRECLACSGRLRESGSPPDST